jgi:hypothetical protein
LSVYPTWVLQGPGDDWRNGGGPGPLSRGNPRRSRSNARLQRDVMRSAEAFRTPAGNRIPDRRGGLAGRYTDRHGIERHYNMHVKIVQTAFDVGARFEDHAAVTELLLCATASSPAFDLTTSPCGKRSSPAQSTRCGLR